MIPPDPKFMSDIDIDLQVFLTKKVENVVKGEQFLSDGHRVILFTTNEITGMMLEKNNEKILKMIEDLNYLAEKVKAAVDKLNK